MKQVDSHKEDFEKVLEEDDGEGGWVDTHHFAGNHAIITITLVMQGRRYVLKHASIRITYK